MKKLPFISLRKIAELGIGAIAIATLILAGCGGGGGSSTPATSGYTVTGQLSGPTNAISGVSVTLDGPYTTTSNASGVYTFTGVAAGNYTLIPSAVGYTYTPLTEAVSVTGNTSAPASFVGSVSVGSTYGISGTVTGLSANTTALLTFTASAVPYATAYTGTNGAYSLGNLPPNSYTVAPTATGYTFSPASAVAVVTTAYVTENFIATLIPQPHNITGAITNDPGGVTITVTCSSSCPVGFTPTTATSSSGSYSVPSLLAGTYTLTPSKTGYTFNPVSTSVTMTGQADATATTFIATANISVKATANGSITGTWLQGVTITLSNGATGTTQTDANGNYSFAQLPSGSSYTFTPSLAGYTFTPASQSVSITAGSSVPVTVTAMAASPAIASYSISGTVSYSGIKTGPVSLLVYNTNNGTCNGCWSSGGTRINLTGTPGSYTGSYTIRGLQNANYSVVAMMDTLGTGQPNASADPMGSATPTIASSNVTSNITLSDPTVTAPTVPSISSISSGNGSALVFYNPPTDGNGNETATSYTISWGTTSAANNSTKTFNAQGTNATVKLMTGLSNTTLYYFKVLATNSNSSSAYSSASSATIGAPASNGSSAFTVSGTVTYPGTASGPMMVILHSPHGGGSFYYTTVSSPSSGGSYSVTGVPAGDYQVALVIDNNNNGVIDAGDFTYGINGGTQTFAVSGNTTRNVALPTSDAITSVLTSYYTSTNGSGYNLNMGTRSGTKTVVNTILISGPNVAVPLDMGVDPNNNVDNVNLADGSTAPTTGQNYGFLVTFSDGSTEIVTGSVGSDVLGPSNVPTGLTASNASGNYTPTFSWTAPATAPTTLPFDYSLQSSWGRQIDVPGGGATSVNLATKGVTLSTGTTYYWQVQVQDAYGNMATAQAASPYVAP